LSLIATFPTPRPNINFTHSFEVISLYQQNALQDGDNTPPLLLRRCRQHEHHDGWIRGCDNKWGGRQHFVKRKRESQQVAPDSRRLYIGNLAYAATEDDLRGLFQGYDVEEATIPVNPRTNRPVGYAFVNVTTPKAVQDAIKYLSGEIILERQVSIQLARTLEGTPVAGSAWDDEEPVRKRNKGRS
jgi:hypothetical protein